MPAESTVGCGSRARSRTGLALRGFPWQVSLPGPFLEFWMGFGGLGGAHTSPKCCGIVWTASLMGFVWPWTSDAP